MAWFSKPFELLQIRRSFGRKADGRALSLPTLLSRSAGFAGYLLGLASVLTSWFSVPAAASFGAPITSEAPLVSWAYRVASLGVCAAAFVIFRRDPRWRERLRRLYLSWILAVLFFPYFVSVWSPDVAGRASWLQNQHESLIDIHGDNYRSQEFKRSLLRDRVDAVNNPFGSQVFMLPDWERQSVDWSMLEWFGLSRWFASFLRRGWPFAIFGSVAILFALLHEEGPAALRTAQQLLVRGAWIFVAALLAALAPLLICRKCLLAAKHCTQSGEYSQAARLMRCGAWCAPAITQDKAYLMETGLLADALGLHDPVADYYRARLAEDAGFHDEAQAMDLEGLVADRGQPALLRQHVNALLRQAENAMDSGEMDSATLMLERTLAADPVNLRAIYLLQLSYLRSGNTEGVDALDQRMMDVYAYFNNLLKDSILATSAENRAASELVDGDPAAAIKTWTESKVR